MKTEGNKRTVIVGLFILVGLVFLIAGILAIGNLHNTFVKKITLVTIFNDVNGLQAGNNILFSGVKIGTVKKMSFFGNSQVKVLMKIDEKVEQYIRKDSKVKISSDGFIGNKIIVIYGGTAAAGPIEDGDMLINETVSTAEDIMNTFQENNKNVLVITNTLKSITGKIDSGQGNLGKLLNDETLYNKTQAVIASLQKATTNIELLSVSLSQFGSKLNKEGSLANDLVTDTTVFKDIQAASMKLKEITIQVQEIMTSLNKATSGTDGPVGVLLNDKQAAENLKITLQNLGVGSAKLNEDLEALQHNFLLRGYFKKKDKQAK